MTFASELRNKLFRSSVLHAAQQIPGYRALYTAHTWDDSDLAGSLLRLPTVTKAQISADTESFLNPDLRTDFLQNTSGSTGACFFLHRAAIEQETIARFFALAEQDAKANLASDGGELVVLRLSAQDHGTMFRIPSAMRGFDQSVVNVSTLMNTVYLLKESDDDSSSVPRINCIQGSLKGIVILTTYLKRNGITFPNLKIEFLVVIGDYMTRAKRCLLEEFWGCPIFSRYSLSEMLGGALGRAGEPFDRFKFDAYSCFEVVAIDDFASPAGNIGELLMTTPYPFIQRQPLIRYRTNDLFRTEPIGPGENEPRYTYLGRKNQSLIVPQPAGGSRLLVPSVAVLEALEDMPGLGFQPWCVYLDDSYRNETLGYHKFRGRWQFVAGRIRAELLVERLSQGGERAAAAELAQRVLASIDALSIPRDDLDFSVTFTPKLEQAVLYELSSPIWDTA